VHYSKISTPMTAMGHSRQIGSLLTLAARPFRQICERCAAVNPVART